MVYLQEETFWEEADIHSDLYSNLISYLTFKGKSWDDVRFISTFIESGKSCPKDCDGSNCNEPDCPNTRAVTINKDDFIDMAKEVELSNISDNLIVTGDNWFITSRNDTFLEMIEIPEQPKEVLNLAKELLVSNDVEVNIPFMVGIAYDPGDDVELPF